MRETNSNKEKKYLLKIAVVALNIFGILGFLAILIHLILTRR